MTRGSWRALRLRVSPTPAPEKPRRRRSRPRWPLSRRAQTNGLSSRPIPRPSFVAPVANRTALTRSSVKTVGNSSSGEVQLSERAQTIPPLRLRAQNRRRRFTGPPQRCSCHVADRAKSPMDPSRPNRVLHPPGVWLSESVPRFSAPRLWSSSLLWLQPEAPNPMVAAG